MALANTSTPAPATPPLSSQEFKGLNGAELMAVYDALAAAVGALQGVMNQPRCAVTDEVRGGFAGYTAAGDIISAFAEWIEVQKDDLVQTARDRETADATDAEMCAWLEIKHLANMMDDPLDLAALAADHAKRLRHYPANKG